MTLLQSGIAKPSSGYDIDQSLRVDGFPGTTNQHLERSPSSSGNRKTFTISFWWKPSLFNKAEDDYVIKVKPNNDNQFMFNKIAGQDKISVVTEVSTSVKTLKTSRVFRDPSSWYHFVIAVDTTQATDSNRVKLYVNGVQETAFDTEEYPDQDWETCYNQSGVNQDLLWSREDSGRSPSGYFAEWHSIDGQALTPASFGETNSDTNQWVPIEVTGMTYGTNGFYQKYSATELANSFTDSSSSSHTITANGDVANARGTNLGTTSTVIDSFTSTGSDTWTCPSGVTSIEVLTVAGGGGGAGYYGGGGGGAGGIVHASSYTVVPGTVYDLTIGAGGASNPGATAQGNDGSDSVFNVNAEGSGLALTSKGGGGGGGYANPPGPDGRDGGSGGGSNSRYGNSGSAGDGGSSTQASFSGATSYGNVGGSNSTSTQTETAGSGGGGAGEAGNTDRQPGTGGNDRGGDGGDGVYFSTFSSYGDSGYFGGGGGGGGGNTSGDRQGGAGGQGGGGVGAEHNTTAAGNGTANTGGGGGGASQHNSSPGSTGGGGGSGVILIAYNKSKPGSSSIKFDGTGDYLSCADSSDWDFLPASGYTAEAWYKPITHAGTDFIIGQSVNGNNYWMLGHEDGAGLRFESYSGGSLVLNITGGEITDTDWHHIAVVRDGSDVEIFKDGTSVATGTTSSTATFAGELRIGEGSAHGAMDGYLDEIRLSNTARYTSSFTPSTTAFTADSNTKLLIHSDFDGGLGADSSGNENDFSATNLVATDKNLDSPTNNFATWNPVCTDTNVTLSEGNLKNINEGATSATIGLDSGKFYWETVVVNGTGSFIGTGIIKASALDTISSAWIGGTNSISYYPNGNIYNNGSSTSSSVPTYTTGDIVGVALDLDNFKLYFSKNGTWINSGDPTSGSTGTGSVATPSSVTWIPAAHGDNSSSAGWVANFGQDSSFAGNKTAQGNGGTGEDFYYTPPTGYKALNSSNLDDPAIALPGDYFNTVAYSGNGSTQSITTGLQPDFTWIKGRSYASNHRLIDSVRGAGERLSSNLTDAETTESNGLTSFNSDGFSVGTEGGYNNSGQTFVSWNWKAGGTASSNTDGNITSSVSANTTSGFSVVGYTGTGVASSASSGRVGHGLSVAPELIIIKSRDDAYNWVIGSNYLTSWHYILRLNDTSAEISSSGDRFNGSGPNAGFFNLGTSTETNESGKDYIAYCFHSIEGYSKVGSYAGNANNDGAFIYTGFRPAFVLAKSYDYAYDWPMVDNKRGPYNVITKGLAANSSDAELDNVANSVDFLSNGFKFRNSHTMFNGSHNYIYLAIAESPFKTSNAR